MKFLNEEHRDAFFDASAQYRINPMDREAGPMLYLLTASHDCRNHMDDLVKNDWGLLLVKEDALKHPWITGGDARIIRLAFNLYTGKATTALTWDKKESAIGETSAKWKNIFLLQSFAVWIPDCSRPRWKRCA